VAKALVITEKPSVARDIVQALGGFTEHDGYWESGELVVTFAVGHLFELLEPEEIDPKYKRWTLADLPVIPAEYQLKKKKGQADRIRVIEKLHGRKDVDRIVNACDAGREGELIFREIMKYLGNAKPIQRLWLQSMTPAAIRDGFRQLRPDAELLGLAAAAECRAYSDWLIGMNATRALTKRLKSRREKTAWSAGRVQTPTLALLVDREAEVLAHVPRPYWRLSASFERDGAGWTGAWFDPDFSSGSDDELRDDRLFDEARARQIAQAVLGHGAVASETRKPSREAPPPLFDLTSLQREGNRRFGWSARRTLSAAQRCYEAHKVLTYPRTDSRCLPSDYRGVVDDVLRTFAGRAEVASEFAPHARRLLDRGLENAGRIFDDSKVSDHFAIIPTGTLPTAALSGDDRRLFDLVMRRFLGAFHPAALWERVERVTEVAGQHFRTRARALMEPGWREVLPPSSASADEDEAAALPPLVPGQSDAEGVPAALRGVEVQAEETRPPARLTEARLLSLMENAGQDLEDEDLAAALHEKGIGTPATRAEIIENLIAKGYATRLGKALRPTVKGIRLIDTLKRVHIDRLASAALTGEIEQHLGEVEKGRRPARDFLSEMEDYAREIVDVARRFEYDEIYGDLPPLGSCPNCGRDVYEMAWFYRCEEKPERDPDCPMRFWKDTSGRYLDRATVAALLRDGRTGTIDGFTARDGRTYRGHLELDRETWKVVVRSEGFSGEGESAQPEYDVDPAPLGRCPICEEHDVVETPTQFVCAGRLKAEESKDALGAAAQRAAGERSAAGPADPAARQHSGPAGRGKAGHKHACGFVLPRTVCKREITREEALTYLRGGRTELLTDFTSRFGRPFSAVLFLKENGRHGFEFPPRGQAAATPAAPGAEGAAAPAPARRKRARPAAKAGGEAPAPAPRTSRRAKSERPAARRAGTRARRGSRRKASDRGGAGASEAPPLVRSAHPRPPERAAPRRAAAKRRAASSRSPDRISVVFAGAFRV
jgi:DNA topoisomerase-3